jgi:hypothetical protein
VVKAREGMAVYKTQLSTIYDTMKRKAHLRSFMSTSQEGPCQVADTERA